MGTSVYDRIIRREGQPKQGDPELASSFQGAAPAGVQRPEAGTIGAAQQTAPIPSVQPYNPRKSAWETVTHAVTPKAQTQEQKPQLSYADLFVQTNPYRQPTREQLEEERKRYKRNAIFAAISDGLSALSNLYYTTKGAPNAYTGGSTLTGKLYERQKELENERKADQEKWLNGYLKALEMDRTKEAAERNYGLQLATLQRQNRQDDETRRVNDANIAYRNAMAEAARQKAESNDALTQSRIDVNNSTINKNNASADKLRSGGGSGTGTKGFKREKVAGGYADIPSNLATDKAFWADVAAEAGLDAYTGTGKNKKLKSVADLKIMVKGSEKGQEALRKNVIKNGGKWQTSDEKPEDRYAKNKISSPESSNNGDVDFETMRM